MLGLGLYDSRYGSRCIVAQTGFTDPMQSSNIAHATSNGNCAILQWATLLSMRRLNPTKISREGRLRRSNIAKRKKRYYVPAMAGSGTTSKMKRPGTLQLLWALVLVSRSVVVVHAANPFSSNVVALDSSNWRQEVLESPHAVFVNICRVG